MRISCWLLALALALGLGVLAPAADPPKADAERIAKLVKQLGSDEFEDREKATKELEAIGTPALEALRAAAKSGEAEVKTRATSILEKVEKKANTEKLLAPTKVKLTFKDTPVADAVAEFNKKSGYTIQLHDPEKKLKDRTVTLDTGEVSFWEAFDQFCEKASLVEATWQDVMKPIGPPRGGPGGGILPTPAPIVVPKDLSNKATPAAPPKDEPAPKKEEPKKDEDVKDTPAPAVKPVAQVAPPAPPAGGGIAAPALKRVAPGFGMIGMDPGVITIVDGKPKTVPTCYSGAVRIRALKEAPNMGITIPFPGTKDETHLLWLEVRTEPKLQLQFIQSVAVEKATDEKDQKLEKVTPAAPELPGGVPGGLPRPAIAPVAPGGFIGGIGGFGGTQYYAVQLKKGEKEAKALKEFAGTITANVMAPAEAVITADKITKAAGETFKGKDGGQIKVKEVKEEDGKITIKFEMETPQNAAGGGAFGGIGIAVPGGPIAVPLPPPPAPIPPAPALPPDGAGFGFQAGEEPPPPVPPVEIQIQIDPLPAVPAVPVGPPVAGKLAPPRPGLFSAPGITLVDDKGKTIAQSGGAPPRFEGAVGGLPKIEYTQEYKLEKDQKPAKLVFSTSKMITLDIPFSFKDVPLK